MPLTDLSDLVIRTAVEEDLPLLHGEADQPYLQFLFQNAFMGMQRGEQAIWVAALSDGKLVGQVCAQFQSFRTCLADGRERAYLYSLHVVPEQRGRGIGTRLLRHLEEDLHLRGFKLVTLTVEKDNERARHLYERIGYRVVGEEVVNVRSEQVKDNWVRNEETAWRMEKAISALPGR